MGCGVMYFINHYLLLEVNIGSDSELDTVTTLQTIQHIEQGERYVSYFHLLPYMCWIISLDLHTITHNRVCRTSVHEIYHEGNPNLE
jgi:hypothetical protein